MEIGREIAAQEGAETEDVHIKPIFLHGPPKGVLGGVREAFPLRLPFPTKFQLVDHQVTPDLQAVLDIVFHLVDPDPIGSSVVPFLPFEIPQATGVVLGGKGVTTLGGAPDGVGVVVGKGL